MKRTALSYSLKTIWNSFLVYVSKHPFILVIFAFVIIQSIVISIIKTNWKKKYVTKFENDKNLTNNQFYITYYKKLQLIEIVRFVLFFVIIALYGLTKNIGIMSYFSIALWAFVITFQNYIVSIAMYITLIRRHTIGDIIKIWSDKDIILWQIIYIKPFSLWVSWMSDDWQNTGELHIIPNHLLLAKPLVKVDLKAENYQKLIISIRYNKDEFKLSFEDFLKILEWFLSKLLPTNSAKTVSHFKTYIGYKYKLDFEYEKEGSIHISIWLITKLRNIASMKRIIISYIESIKTKDKIDFNNKELTNTTEI